MAKTLSTMSALGTKAHPFSLINVVDGSVFHFTQQHTHKATVIMFICNHCPYVKHILEALVSLTKTYQNNETILFIGINSNDVNAYPDDAPIHMQSLAKEMAFTFPYLFDETQDVAKTYHAACTPDFFVFNNENSLVYRGQFDNSRPGNAIIPTGKDLKTAIDCLLNDIPIPDNQLPSLGCNIKWKDN
jgi:thiol-disulfide isomerase/thioredoxin